MALSFRNVQNAYKVFNELQRTVLPQLRINSFPEDMATWPEIKQENPTENEVFGYDHKSDGGWENLMFFVKNPSNELKEKFDELKGQVGNTSMSEPYRDNKSYWIFGWF